jgi:hypothetical protein
MTVYYRSEKRETNHAQLLGPIVNGRTDPIYLIPKSKTIQLTSKSAGPDLQRNSLAAVLC